MSPTLIIWDWQHIYLCNGVATWEVEHMLTALTTRFDVTMEDIRHYFEAEWLVSSMAIKSLPQRRSVRYLDDGCPRHLKADASTTLYIAHVLEHFVETVIEPRGVLRAETRSFHAMCACLRTATCMKFTGTRPHAPTLLRNAQSHLDLFVEAYGDAAVKPKHHFALHLGDQFKDRQWLDCFVLERKHRNLKRRAQDCKNLVNFEATVLQSCLMDQLQLLDSVSLELQAEGKTVDAPAIGDGWVAAPGFVSHVLSGKQGDVVWVSDVLFRIEGCVSNKDRGELHMVGTVLEQVGPPVSSHGVFRARQTCMLVSLADTVYCAALKTFLRARGHERGACSARENLAARYSAQAW